MQLFIPHSIQFCQQAAMLDSIIGHRKVNKDDTDDQTLFTAVFDVPSKIQYQTTAGGTSLKANLIFNKLIFCWSKSGVVSVRVYMSHKLRLDKMGWLITQHLMVQTLDKMQSSLSKVFFTTYSLIKQTHFSSLLFFCFIARSFLFIYFFSSCTHINPVCNWQHPFYEENSGTQSEIQTIHEQ